MPYDNNGGLPLQTVGDDIQIIQTNNAIGQDGGASFTVTPGVAFSNVTLVFEKCFTATDFAAGVWSPLPYVLLAGSGSTYLPNGTYILPSSGTYNFAVSQTVGFYAIRMRLSAISAGTLIGSGFTFAVLQVSNPVSLAALQNMTTLLLANALAMSDLNNTDYLAAVGGSF